MSFQKTLEEDSLQRRALTWLLIGVGGLVFGFFFISGPLTWYFARQIRKEAQAEEREVPQMATAAWAVGWISMGLAFLMFLIMAVVIAVILFDVALFAAFSGATLSL